MKSVLISIKPEWCELIATGAKTLEIRKTRPKLETPFKCYIYRTKGKVKHLLNGKWFNMPVGGSIIGEFICDNIINLFSESRFWVTDCIVNESCLSPAEIRKYANGGNVYGWHISDLKIYAKPKNLSEFHTWKKCKSCSKSGYESTACAYDENCMVPAAITKAPQSWRYVEDNQNEF